MSSLPPIRNFQGFQAGCFWLEQDGGGEVRKNKKNRTEQNGEGLGCKRIPNQSRGVNAK